MTRTLIPRRKGFTVRYVRKDLRTRQVWGVALFTLIILFGLGGGFPVNVTCGLSVVVLLFILWRNAKGFSVYIGPNRVLIAAQVWDRIWSFDELSRADAEPGIFGAMGWPKTLLVLYSVDGSRYASRDYCCPRSEVGENSAAAVAAVINQQLESYRASNPAPGT